VVMMMVVMMVVVVLVAVVEVVVMMMAVVVVTVAVLLRDAHRTVKVAFQDFPEPFTSIFHVFPALFNRVDIEQVRCSYTFTKSINKSTKHLAHNIEYVSQFITCY